MTAFDPAPPDFLSPEEQDALQQITQPMWPAIEERAGERIHSDVGCTNTGHLKVFIQSSGAQSTPQQVELIRHHAGGTHLELHTAGTKPIPVNDASAAGALELDLTTWHDCRTIWEQTLERVASDGPNTLRQESLDAYAADHLASKLRSSWPGFNLGFRATDLRRGSPRSMPPTTALYNPPHL